MLKLSLKNRIAFYYIISSAILIFVVFVSIYLLISLAVYRKVNQNINYEVEEYQEKIDFECNKVKLRDKDEWLQREHNEVSVDPVFLEIRTNNGFIIEKSGNLKSKNLFFIYGLKSNTLTDIKLSGKLIRQIQVPLYNKGVINGYLLVAVSLEEATAILNNLKMILYISFPIILLFLFIVARLIAGKSIKPINAIIRTSNTITNDNLKARIDLPKNKDELYTLSETINNLLDRIENTIEREKQFTSDASHELRTPLAVIKGTLEVLIRKPRNREEYQEKINYCIAEVDRMNTLVDQLLLLARYENQKLSLKKQRFSLSNCLDEVIDRFEEKASQKSITIKRMYSDAFWINADIYFMEIILHNLISNALKYSNPKGVISISITNDHEQVVVRVMDNGIGISKEEITKVFDSFYRASINAEIKGTGLGLSIAKRLCSILNIAIAITSEENIGTTVILTINTESKRNND